MASQETQAIDSIIASRRTMMLGGGAALAALAFVKPAAAASAVTAYSDNDILNFALNLEYLEANFYYLAAFGTTIDVANAASKAAGAPVITLNGSVGTAGTVLVKPNPQVPFKTIQVGSYAVETAIEEGKHVATLQSVLNTAAVAQPALDLMTSFDILANAAGIGPAFDPFASDASFVVGAYIFEDVGVSAYHGAAPLIMNKTILSAAVGIHAVEAYHAGLIRTTILELDPTGSKGLLGYTQKISALRTKLAQQAPQSPANPDDPTPDDYGVADGGPGNSVMLGTSMVSRTSIVDADPINVQSFARSTTQVLNIVTGGGALTVGAKAKGVFFPNGLNGLFS